MNDPKLQIKRKKYTGETSIISMRISKDMLKDIDEIAETSGRTRNEILSLSLEFALEHMELEENE